jgi:hypothetical protein
MAWQERRQVHVDPGHRQARGTADASRDALSRNKCESWDDIQITFVVRLSLCALADSRGDASEEVHQIATGALPRG